jgi:hypothetical protein
MTDPHAAPGPPEEERAQAQALLAAHEDLIAAARGFGATLAAEGRGARHDPDALEDLEDMARRLDEAALAYGEARGAYGPCEWVFADVLGAGEARELAEALGERSAALYEAAEAVADLAQGAPAAALEAARGVLSRAAVAFYELSRSVVAYQATLRRRT